MRNKVGITLLLLALFFLSGCKTTLLVSDSKTSEVISAFKDYVGIHGYKITYENDATGSYRLSLGSVYVPNVSETTKIKTKTVTARPVDIENGRHPMTAYEETNLKTVSTPGHYVKATAMVSITQLDDNVFIAIETNNVTGASLDDIVDYLREVGFTVEKK